MPFDSFVHLKNWSDYMENCRVADDNTERQKYLDCVSFFRTKTGCLGRDFSHKVRMIIPHIMTTKVFVTCFFRKRGTVRMKGNVDPSNEENLNMSYVWMEEELEKLVGMQHVICDAVGVQWPQVRDFLSRSRCKTHFSSKKGYHERLLRRAAGKPDPIIVYKF